MHIIVAIVCIIIFKLRFLNDKWSENYGKEAHHLTKLINDIYSATLTESVILNIRREFAAKDTLLQHLYLIFSVNRCQIETL